MDLWLASALSPYGRFHATPKATEEGIAGWVVGAGSTAVWTSDSFAYVTLRHAAAAEENASRFELGVIAHGPDRRALTDQLAERVQFWDQTHRPGPEPVIHAYPAGTPDGQLHEGRVIDKRHARLVLSWA